MTQKEINAKYFWVENEEVRKWFWIIDNGGLNPENKTMGKPDMQDFIIRGYVDLNAARYIFLKIENKNPALIYLRKLTNNITKAELDKSFVSETAMNIAFTISGLKALGLHESVYKTFSREFIEGMCYNYEENELKVAERSTLLGDTGHNKPSDWIWGFKEKTIDCVIMLFAKNKCSLNTLQNCILSGHEAGLRIEYKEDTVPFKVGFPIKEHFGFNDGISQPKIRGIKKSATEFNDDKLFNPGEFILGYLNQYNDYSPSPYVDDNEDSRELDYLPKYSDKKDLGKNGTYLVFRQIEQHVEEFWKYNYSKSKETGYTPEERAINLAAKMIGRFPDGKPLVEYPGNENDYSQNDFNYYEHDKHGIQCPFGAHIRRTNPRDQAHAGRGRTDSIEISKKHNMIRRGRLYGPPYEDFDILKMIANVKQELNNSTNLTPADKKEPIESTSEESGKIPRGLFFISLVSDISRQFEFVQSAWANTPTFADLYNEVDPIISPRESSDPRYFNDFTTPQERVRKRYIDVPQFTKVVGGAYFFMPGIRALNYILKDRSNLK